MEIKSIFVMTPNLRLQISGRILKADDCNGILKLRIYTHLGFILEYVSKRLDKRGATGACAPPLPEFSGSSTKHKVWVKKNETHSKIGY